jgi:II/X family phage/plasmid replication protein
LVQLPLPPLSCWKVHRVDWAECYQLPSFESCSEYFRGLNASDYPRRSVNRYGNSGLYAPGCTTATKFYHKGVEFAKHDRTRLRNLLKPTELNDLQHFANTVIRVEVEIKAEKLRYDFGDLPIAAQITQDYLLKVFDSEVYRILREGQKEMEIVRNARLVEARLYQVYKPALAGVLLGTWFRFSTLGEDAVKKALSKPTFYRQRKQLVEAGCDWHQTDVRLVEASLIPQGFTLRRGTQWHLSEQDPKVLEQLAPYIAA